VDRRAKLRGSHFRRQSPVGPFIVNFACRAARLVVEVDGNALERLEAREHDAQRDAWLLRAGYRVLRFANAEVLSDPARVSQMIIDEAEALLRQASPTS
jgi:very-short-patch-repair endonuclease